MAALAATVFDWSNPASIGGLLTVIASLTAAVISIINAWAAARDRRAGAKDRQEIKAKVDESNVKADQAASHATVAAEKTAVVDTKLDQIQQKAEETKANTDGHLSRITAELQKEQARNQALNEAVLSLTAILSAQRASGAPIPPESMPRGSRATDAPGQSSEPNVTLTDKHE